MSLLRATSQGRKSSRQKNLLIQLALTELQEDEFHKSDVHKIEISWDFIQK